MDGPPGSQGVIVRQGKKKRNKNNSGQTQVPHQQCQNSGQNSQTNNKQRDLPATQGMVVGAGAGKQIPGISASDANLLANPNVPLSSVSLRDTYVRLSGYASTAISEASSPRGHHALSRQFSLLPYPRGIMNSSNFCFMNSIMQALIFTPAFTQLAISAIGEASLCPNLAAVGKWMLQYWKPGLTRLVMQPPQLPFITGRRSNSGGGASQTTRRVASVDGSSQQDAQEFLQYMLEVIRDELIQLEKDTQEDDSDNDDHADGDNSTTDTRSNARSSSSKGWKIVRGKERLTVREHVDKDGNRSALIDALFGGTVESHLAGKSRQRNHASVVVERFYSLPVDIGYSMETTIEEAIERTMTMERIYDEEKNKELKKTLSLGLLPNVLFLHLRRWAVTAEGELVKLDNRVRYGRTLVLPRRACSDNAISNKDRTYRLLSVVCHRGGATAQGHYVTYITHGVANPANVSVVGTTDKGPQPYTKQQMQQIHKPQKGGQKGPAGSPGSNQSAALSRHPVDPAQVVLCNDAKVSVCSSKDMFDETAYFLVYQKVA